MEQDEVSGACAPRPAPGPAVAVADAVKIKWLSFNATHQQYTMACFVYKIGPALYIGFKSSIFAKIIGKYSHPLCISERQDV